MMSANMPVEWMRREQEPASLLRVSLFQCPLTTWKYQGILINVISGHRKVMEMNRNLNGLYDFVSSLETPVEIVRPPTDVFEPPGSDVVYEVELNKDRVEVKWLRNNMSVVQGDKYQMMSEGKIHRLQVCEIRPRDQGEYRVIAKDKDARAKLELAGKMNLYIYI